MKINFAWLKDSTDEAQFSLYSLSIIEQHDSAYQHCAYVFYTGDSRYWNAKSAVYEAE